jgi:hypothetical protein
MKLLIAFSVLVSATAFALPHNGGDEINCYEQAQGNNQTPAYTFETKGYGPGRGAIFLEYPRGVEGALYYKNGCLKNKRGGNPTMEAPKPEFEACLGEGQHIGSRIPVDIYWDEEHEGTVYCEESLEKWFMYSGDTSVGNM